jgi:uncharacterized protein YecE (DUF72 family)
MSGPERPRGDRRGERGPRRSGPPRAPGEAGRRRLSPLIRIGVTVEPTPDLGGQPANFRVVEADASTTALAERVVGAWLDHTPEGFVVDVRAHRILTHHPAPSGSVWPEVRDALSPRALDIALARFLEPLRPLHEAGRLGALVFAFPSYFQPSAKSRDYLAWLRNGSAELPIAVEFRHRDWVNSANRVGTFAFLEEQRLAYVSVDAPSGVESSLPPLAVATAGLAVVRFHGRALEAWERAVDSGDEQFAFEYRLSDFEPWLPRIEKLVAGKQPVHVLMNTPGNGAATRNARLLIRMLTEPPGSHPPEPPKPSGPPKRRHPPRR